MRQNENKTLQDAEKDNHAAWDKKFTQLLWQLQDYQEAKDHPQAQIINVEIEDLFVVRTLKFDCFLTGSCLVSSSDLSP